MREEHRMRRILVEHVRIIDPVSGMDCTGDILLEGDRILELGEGAARGLTEAELAECERIEGRGLTAAPGLVDVHVHFRDPGFTHKEDIETGARAAAKGGFTTVVLMANTYPCVDNADTLRYIVDKGAGSGIRVMTCANVTMGMKGKELTPMKELAQAGAVGFTDDGVPIMDAGVLRSAMETAVSLGMPISLHEENPGLISDNGVNSDIAMKHLGLKGSPREAENSLVERDLQIALETGAVTNVQHISTAEAVELVRQAKRKGGNIHAEAAPHHFTLTQEAVVTYGTNAKMNPPLRLERDRLAILEGLKDGTIDMIATDHAPHAREEKEREFRLAPSGIIGLETALALGITYLVKPGHLSLMELVGKMSSNPAAMYHMETGSLRRGGPADLVLFDENELLPTDSFLSRSSNTPFTNWELYGRVEMTICRGRIVYRR